VSAVTVRRGAYAEPLAQLRFTVSGTKPPHPSNVKRRFVEGRTSQEWTGLDGGPSHGPGRIALLAVGNRSFFFLCWNTFGGLDPPATSEGRRFRNRMASSTRHSLNAGSETAYHSPSEHDFVHRGRRRYCSQLAAFDGGEGNLRRVRSTKSEIRSTKIRKQISKHEIQFTKQLNFAVAFWDSLNSNVVASDFRMSSTSPYHVTGGRSAGLGVQPADEEWDGKQNGQRIPPAV